ncbi:MAG: hypothetical protein ABL867_05930 [Rickettsiales bacterium]
MKKLWGGITVLWLILLPVRLFADEVQTPTICFEHYSASFKQSWVLMNGEKGTPSESGQYSNIISIIQEQLKAVKVQNPSDADYHFIFIDIQPTYEEASYISSWYDKLVHGKELNIPEIDPVIPKNKHYGTEEVPYSFSSPWMRGTFYIKDGKPTGGTIIMPISEFAKIDELYNASHQNWEEFSVRNSTILHEMSIPYESIYKSTLELYRNMFVGTKESIPTEKRITELFSEKGKGALVLARLARISHHTTFIPFEGEVYDKWNKCIKHSNIFYVNLYKYLVMQLFEKTTALTDEKAMHDITPPNKILQSIHEAAGNYNCFSSDFKEDTK